MIGELAGTKVGFIDCETTGVGDHDEPISIGIVVVAIDQKGYGEPFAEWYGEQKPSVPIHPKAQAVHGQTVASLDGKVFELPALRAVLSQVDVLVAHNAKFDSRMIGKVEPEVLKRPWRCSYRQWVWPNLVDKKLDSACLHFSVVRAGVHNALSDAHALRKALMVRRGKTERSSTYLAALLRSHDFWIEGAPRPSETPVVSIHWFNREYVQKMQVGDRLNLEIGPSHYDIRGIVPDGRGTWVVLKVLIEGNEWIYNRLASGQELDMVVRGVSAGGIDLGIVERDASAGVAA